MISVTSQFDGAGRLFHGEGELGALAAVGGFDVGEIADGVLALEHGAQRLGFAHAVFAFFEEDAEAGDLGVGNGGGIDEVAGELEILLEDGLEEGVGDAERVGHDGLGNGLAGRGRQGDFLDRPLAVLALEVEENPVAAGFLAVEFERPAGAGVEFEFADFADAVRLAEVEAGGGKRLEASAVCGIERVLADEAGERGEIAGFERLGDAVDEIARDRLADTPTPRSLRIGFGVLRGDGGFIEADRFSGAGWGFRRRAGRWERRPRFSPRTEDQQHERGDGEHGGKTEEEIGKLGAVHDAWR